MRVTNIKQQILSFYRESGGPTFWFSVVVLSQLCAFLPQIPSVLVYVFFFLYAGYVFTRPARTYCKPLLLFIIYIPFQLLIVSPDSMFHSWERYVLFVLLLFCVSPLVVGEATINFRKTIFKMIGVVCIFIGVGSFFARFLGINYGSQRQIDFILNIGTFGGLTSHSMLLGPIAGVGVLFCSWIGFRTKKYIYWILSALCAFSVMFSASRSSLMAMMAGMTILIYKLSATKTTFIKVIVGIIMLGAITFPVWGGALDSVLKKNELNIEAGSALSSRDALWRARILEFKNSPLFGVGFDALNLDIAREVGGFDEQTGMVESGSSWLIILSMTGIIGLMLLLPLFIVTYRSAFLSKCSLSSLICGVLTLFYVHMIAEGYIFYGGSLLAFMLWTTIGVAYDCKYSFFLHNQ